MSDFSDYIVYVDESGDHGLASIDPQYPVFVLAFCIFRKDNYANHVTPALQNFKFRWFGEDTVVLHEADIRRKKGPFWFLDNSTRREAFMEDISSLMEDAPMTIIASVIKKQNLVRRYQSADNPYHLSLVFCMEKLDTFLAAHGQTGRTTHIIFEQRGGKEFGGREDKELELEFYRIKQGRHYLCHRTFPDLDHRIVSKKINSGGLQLADLVARPIGLHCLNTSQPNRAYEIIGQKIMPHTGSGMKSWGLKIFP